MNFPFVNEALIINFCLVLLRVGGFLFAWPLLGGLNVPVSTKAIISLLIALVLFPTINSSVVISYNSWLGLFIGAIVQTFIGLAMAFVCHMFFYIINSGASLISLSLGLSSAQIYNPVMGYSVTSFEHFYFIFAGLFFLSVQGHHVFLQGLSDSFQLMPLNNMTIDLKRTMSYTLVCKDVMEIGLKLAGPVLITILVMNVTLGLIGRTVPQINVLVTSMPINILVGLTLMAICMPFVVNYFSDILNDTSSTFYRFMRGY